MAPYKFTNLVSSNQPIEMYGDGSSKRDYTYVTDIVDGIIAALNKELNFEIINIGNSHPIELKYFIELIEKNLNKKANIIQKPIQPGDVPITYADVSKAKESFNFGPIFDLTNGLEKTIRWFQKMSSTSAQQRRSKYYEE